LCHPAIIGTSSALHRQLISPASCRPIGTGPNFILTNRAVRQGRTRRNIMKIITAVAAVAAIIVSSLNVAAAVAAPAPGEARVGYADLDLSSPKGQQALEQRIKAAARSVCGVDANERQLMLQVDAGRCYRTTVANAFADAARTNPTMVASR
jgi:UrcA family protein